jgi:vancomycin resistance protein YoaR
MSPRQIVSRGLLTGLVAALFCGGLLVAYVGWYSRTDRIFPGVLVGDATVGGLTMNDAQRRMAGADPGRRPVMAGGAGAAGGSPVGGQPGKAAEAGVTRLRLGDRTWPLDGAVAGTSPDVQGALKAALAVGRNGSALRRTNQFLAGLVHGHYLPLEANLREQALVQRLEEIAGEVNRPPVDAAYNFEMDAVTPEAPGEALDTEATVRAVRQALQEGRTEAELVLKPVAAAVTEADLTDARRHQIARFTTPILAADAGRVQNIAMAVRKISGVALAPGQTFSFNDVVGPRDAEHGWAPAKELYQGEFVVGYGGGICQVSSTLYNSVLLAGLEVKERYHHDRPLQYVDPGLDATVAWKVLDFRFRNNTDATMLLSARIVPGAPQQIEVILYAPRPATSGEVALETTDFRYFPPALEEIPDPTLPANSRQVIDEGHYGMEVSVYRIYRSDGKERRELVSRDTYQPKAGKVKIGTGNKPGAERLLRPGVR